MDAPTYVVRSADRYLYKALKLGSFYILNARQMGKSSLMVRMMRHLQQRGSSVRRLIWPPWRRNITPAQWYKGLMVELWQSFDLLGKVNLKAWMSKRFIARPVLESIYRRYPSKSSWKWKIFIFVDEIDSVLGKISLNDFALFAFATTSAVLIKISAFNLALFGVATPSDLINDYKRTPLTLVRQFN